jgi:hypothetical protein
MLKWIYYAKELLRRGGVDVEQPRVDHLVQGFLQHYGGDLFLSISQHRPTWQHGFLATALPPIVL